MFQNRLTDLLGITYPIVQGGMQWISRAELVSAVSNAGGLGILSALTFPTPQELSSEILRTRKLTRNPFGVNLTLLPTMRPANIEGYIDAVIDGDVRIVETAGRNPQPYMDRLKSAGITVIHKCVAVRFAQTAERIGCDVISIDGFECAGHPGEEDLTSLILIPLTVDAISIPVVASGGFGDARGFVAAMALGAEGVNMGTRFVATREAPVHPAVKEWFLRSSELDTRLVQRSLRNSHRVLRNAVSQEVEQMESQGASLEDLLPLITGQRGKQLLESGDLDAGLQACGQVVGLIRDIPSVQELIDRIISQASSIIDELGAATKV